MSNAMTRPATAAATFFNSWVAEIVRSLAAMFETTAPLERERALHRLLLAVVLGVGILVRFWHLGTPGLHGDDAHRPGWSTDPAERHVLSAGHDRAVPHSTLGPGVR